MTFDNGDYVVNIYELKAACFDYLRDLSFEGVEKLADIRIGMAAVIDMIGEVGQEMI